MARTTGAKNIYKPPPKNKDRRRCKGCRKRLYIARMLTIINYRKICNEYYCPECYKKAMYGNNH